MARAIMLQGTMSNVGKSFLCAALCRIFAQDGYSAAPFKSQNMALNSYITSDGLEIGRAQAMQAEAAGIEPSVLMNPILLKPTTDVGSQVIVNGEVRGNMRAADYFRYKKTLVPEIKSAYETLAAQHDIIVIEGAGSPAELNLKRDDIVNMGMAEIADAPVLLVGDIDRGGVFAQLLGTLSLLEKHEQERVKGFIINKFSGDIRLFDDGVKILEEKGGKLVVGVVPYLNCDIEDEDSLSDKLNSNAVGAIDIAVIRLPRISNFTDFDVFGQYDGVLVRYVNNVSKLGNPDMIIIPGSKSVISDLKWLRETGLEAAIKRMTSVGVPIFGICGGYQMLGNKISAPNNAESGGEIRGMELLDIETVFCTDKKRKRAKGKIIASGGYFPELNCAFAEGYEIHLGETAGSEKPLLEFADGRRDGVHRDNIYGTYLHGFFDSKAVADAIIKTLSERKGVAFGEAVNRAEYKRKQFDIIADGVRKNIDMKSIYDIIGLNGKDY